MKQTKTKLISTTMLAARFGFSSQYIRKLIAEGKIRATKIGHDWIIDEKEVRHLKRKRHHKVKENTDGDSNAVVA